MKHKSSSKCVINAEIPQNFIFIFLYFKWAKKNVEIRLWEKPKALSAGRKLLKQLFNVLHSWICESFPYKISVTATKSYNDCNKWTWRSLISQNILSKFSWTFSDEFQILKVLFLDKFWVTAFNAWVWIDKCKCQILTLSNQKVADENLKNFPTNLVL